MGVSILRCLLSWALVVAVPLSLLGQSTPQGNPAQTAPAQSSAGQSPSGQSSAGQAAPAPAPTTQGSPTQETTAPGPPAQGPAGAILHTQGGVWVNGNEARDSTAIFPGDLLETKPGFSATLNLDGSEVLLAPETVAKFTGDTLEVDYGGVSIGTSKSFKVRVKCITVVPALNAWTQYEVNDLTGTVQVTARKGDVNVEVAGAGKPAAGTTIGGTLHEGEQKSYDSSELCGAAPQPTSPGSGISPKWIAAGAAGAGVLIWILVHGSGGQNNVSQSTP
jgi:hypothetical protein